MDKKIKKIIDTFYDNNKQYLFLKLWTMIDMNIKFFKKVLLQKIVEDLRANNQDFTITINNDDIVFNKKIKITKFDQGTFIEKIFPKLLDVETSLEYFIWNNIIKKIKDFEKFSIFFIGIENEEGQVYLHAKFKCQSSLLFEKIDKQKLKKFIKDNFKDIFYEILPQSISSIWDKSQIFNFIQDLNFFKKAFMDYVYSLVFSRNYNIFRSVPKSILPCFLNHRKIKKFLHKIRTSEEIIVKQCIKKLNKTIK